MSKLLKKAIDIPEGVKVNFDKKSFLLSATGKTGNMELNLNKNIELKIDDKSIFVLKNDKIINTAFLGLYWALIRNLIQGVDKGFEKILMLIGVGFRANVEGAILSLKVGYSKEVKLEIPNGLNIKIEKNTQIIIKGVDKQLVGQFAAMIRQVRKPEPYKGKGIRYLNEYVRKKAGKSAAKGK